MDKKLNRYFAKEDLWMENKYMKQNTTSLVIREMQTQTTIRYFPITIRMTKLK